MKLRVSKHSNQPCSVIFVNLYNFLNNDVIICRHLSAQEIVNWVTTADGCVHIGDTTKLSPTSCEFVFTPPTPTRQNSFVASASACVWACIYGGVGASLCYGYTCICTWLLLCLRCRYTPNYSVKSPRSLTVDSAISPTISRTVSTATSAGRCSRNTNSSSQSFSPIKFSSE